MGDIEIEKPNLSEVGEEGPSPLDFWARGRQSGAMSSELKAPVPEDFTPDSKPVPNRSKRYSIYPEGDFEIYKTARPAQCPACKAQVTPPPRTLAPFSEPMRFKSVAEAVKFLKANGSRFQGSELAIIRHCRHLQLLVDPSPSVIIRERPRKLADD